MQISLTLILYKYRGLVNWQVSLDPTENKQALYCTLRPSKYC